MPRALNGLLNEICKPMDLLAESGATKTDWVFFDENGQHQSFKTAGINPMVQTESQIREGALQELADSIKNQPQELHFYGAGLRTQDKRDVMEKLLLEVLPQTNIHIEHDLLGASRSACGSESGIVCILGTGSNSCWFDGKDIVFEMGGNGYLFGDEGSGADLGRHFIKKCLDLEIKDDLLLELEEFAGKPLMGIRNEAYQHPRPNYYFAGFSKFLAAKLDNFTVRMFVISRFTEFLSKTVMRYTGYTDVPVHFVGSVAHVYQYELGEACKMMGIKPGKVLQSPAHALVEYHRSRLAVTD